MKQTMNKNYSKKDIMECIAKIEDLFEMMGVPFRHNWSCCMSCGHAEAELEGYDNYVFYHEQEGDCLREGNTELHLAFSFTDEMKPKVLDMIKANSDIIQWSGNNHTTIYVTCDPNLMKKQIESDKKRQASKINTP